MNKKILIISLLITTLFGENLKTKESDLIERLNNKSGIDKYYIDIDKKLNKFKSKKYNLTYKTIINIDKNGKFSYKTIKESDIQKFNLEVKLFLENQTKIKYPKNIKNRKDIKVDFKTME